MRKPKTPAQKRAQEQKRLKKKCDILWAQIVRDNARGVCEMCGKPGHDAHHAVSRRQSFLRHAVCNGVYLCCGCHMRLHSTEAYTFWTWFAVNRKDDHDFVIQHKHTLQRNTDYAEVFKRLEGMKELSE